jgi:hypothetical protein
MKGTMNHAKASFSTEIFAVAIISGVQYLAPLRYVLWQSDVQGLVASVTCEMRW